MVLQVLEQIDRPPVDRSGRRHQPRPGYVRAQQLPLFRREEVLACRSSVSTAKNAFLCGILQRKVLATQTARSAYARIERRTVIGVREDVVDEDAPVDEIDRPPAATSVPRS